MQMPEADAGAVHRAANQNRNLFLKRVHIIPEDIKNSSKNIERILVAIGCEAAKEGWDRIPNPCLHE